MIDHEHNHGSDRRHNEAQDERAVAMDSHHMEDKPANERTDQAQDDVHHDPFAALVHDLTS